MTSGWRSSATGWCSPKYGRRNEYITTPNCTSADTGEHRPEDLRRGAELTDVVEEAGTEDDRCRDDHAEWFGVRREQRLEVGSIAHATTSATPKPMNIASPPTSGSGSVWTVRSFGRYTQPSRRASFRTSGVATKVTAAAINPMRRYEPTSGTVPESTASRSGHAYGREQCRVLGPIVYSRDHVIPRRLVSRPRRRSEPPPIVGRQRSGPSTPTRSSSATAAATGGAAVGRRRTQTQAGVAAAARRRSRPPTGRTHRRRAARRRAHDRPSARCRGSGVATNYVGAAADPAVAPVATGVGGDVDAVAGIRSDLLSVTTPRRTSTRV